MVFDSSETYLYSADLRGNKIWTHKKDPESGHLSLISSIEAPDSLDHPRWVAIHPSDAYLYVLMEAGNRLAVYVIDEQTHCPVFTHMTYPLIPPGMCLFWLGDKSSKLQQAYPILVGNSTAQTLCSYRIVVNTSSRPLELTNSISLAILQHLHWGQLETSSDKYV